MRAIHINSAAPFFAKAAHMAETSNTTKKPDYRQSRAELYCMALSALLWKKNGGDIALYCDAVSVEYYARNGFLSLYDRVDNTIPADLNGIDPMMFWAAGKILALKKQTAPVVMLDTDFLVWEMPDFQKTTGIIAAHREDLSPEIYPDFSSFNLRPDYTFRPDWDETVLPCNTAFLYIPDDEFLETYCAESERFMHSAYHASDFLTYMVFAEQRIVAMEAERLGVPITVLLDKDRLFLPQEKYTHLWGAKQILRDNHAEEAKFTARCRARIKKDFPAAESIIDKIEKM
ncbi:hypothetical protein FACS189499_07280 [Clostridia bacterium]|nr:hypothetical protein FACS189499_07280 [Clostridia bacterium]